MSNVKVSSKFAKNTYAARPGSTFLCFEYLHATDLLIGYTKQGKKLVAAASHSELTMFAQSPLNLRGQVFGKLLARDGVTYELSINDLLAKYKLAEDYVGGAVVVPARKLGSFVRFEAKGLTLTGVLRKNNRKVSCNVTKAQMADFVRSGLTGRGLKFSKLVAAA